MSDFRRGPAEQSPLLINIKNQALKVAPYICYEIVYPDFVRKMAKQSDLLLTISDDSWFGSSAGPLQHLQMARMRAIENGKYLMRGTNTGVTAIIDDQGQLIAQARPFVKGSLTGEVWRTSGQTPYSRLGSWPVLLLCTVLIAVCVRNRTSLP
ncbi:Apolipoprotein N-acyltransferase / Copper homeostasis protein CutE [gamma proteobacterium IMCC2047]|nr:Apolipoprotein N-acyltransferase / Copper homeostasis protein CutE [gamma proteobacterium IMCC2047]